MFKKTSAHKAYLLGNKQMQEEFLTKDNQKESDRQDTIRNPFVIAPIRPNNNK